MPLPCDDSQRYRPIRLPQKRGSPGRTSMSLMPSSLTLAELLTISLRKVNKSLTSRIYEPIGRELARVTQFKVVHITSLVVRAYWIYGGEEQKAAERRPSVGILRFSSTGMFHKCDRDDPSLSHSRAFNLLLEPLAAIGWPLNGRISTYCWNKCHVSHDIGGGKDHRTDETSSSLFVYIVLVARIPTQHQIRSFGRQSLIPHLKVEFETPTKSSTVPLHHPFSAEPKRHPAEKVTKDIVSQF